MNQRQKEILQAQLDSEKAVLKKLEANYQDALDEINSKIESLMSRQDADMQHVIYQVEYQKALKTQVQSILEQLQTNEFETVSEYLTQSYEDGFIGTMYDLQGQGIPLVIPIDQKAVVEAITQDTKLSENLYTALGHDMTELKKRITGEISRGLSNGQMYNEIARNVSSWARIPKNNAMRIARTESHRIQCKAASDAQYKAKENGADVVKQWDSSLDGKTRKSHRKLDGQIRELDEPFEVNGHKAMFPGDFGRPEEDINCRCAVLQRARWALGNNYTKWSEDAEIEYSDDGTAQLTIIEADNYKDFQKKYKQASERVRDSAQMISSFDNCKSVKELNTKATEVFAKYGIDDVDFSGVDLDIAKKNANQLESLLSQYNTELASIETTTSKKYLGNVQRSGNTKKELETATMQLSKKYAGKKETWIDEVVKGIEKGDSPKIKPENYEIYPLTHEFAHTFGNDYINMFYGFNKNDDFWKEVDDIRREYQKAYQRDKSLSLGKYATTNNDEFIAECFAEALLSDEPSEYSIRTKSLIDKYFKKEALEKTGKSSKVLFKEASTTDEAEQYAEQFVSSFKNKYSGNISYKSIDVEYANKVNKVLTDTFSRYDGGTLNNIQAINFKDKRFKDSTASAAYDWGSGTLYYNGRYFKNAKAFETHKKEADDLLKKVLDNADELLNKPNLSEWQKKHLKTLVNTGRECVAQSYDFTEATFTHEMGHFLDDKVFKLQLVQNNDFLAKSMDKYAGNISGYAVSSKQEYVAESYVAYCFGETDILDPELVKIFKGAEK